VPDANSSYLKRAKIGAYQKLNFRKNIFDLNGIFYFLPKALRLYLKNKWGIVTEADVDMILDASGFNYGDQWSTVLLKQAAIEASRFKKKNKHYVFMPQALGPFSTVENKAAAKKAFEAASVVFAREIQSYNFSVSCSKKANIVQSADFTNLVSPSSIYTETEFEGMVAIVPNSKMLSLQNKNELWRKNYLNVIVSVVNAFIDKGERVFLLNHEGKADQTICDKINTLVNTPVRVISPNSPLAVKALIAQSKAVVCSRYHGCVSALSNGVPCLSTSWSHKYEQLFSEYSVSNLLLSADISNKEVSRLVDHVLERKSEIATSLEPNIIHFKQQSEEMWNQIFNLTRS